MHILIVQDTKIPAFLYGAIERLVWGLGKELIKQGHKVSYLVSEGSFCDFADVYFLNKNTELHLQIPTGIDFIHFNFQITKQESEQLTTPYLITQHGNVQLGVELDANTVFISEDHAHRHNSSTYVYNGLDWDDYGDVNLQQKRSHFHFLAKASRRGKNVQGAIDVIKKTKNESMIVLGGDRLNLKRHFRFTLSKRIQFAGMVGGKEKFDYINHSKGLIFPVKWHEPFGIAIIESLYFGCPIFATPYGASPELVGKSVGFLSDNVYEMADAIQHASDYNPKICHELAVEEYNSKLMMQRYFKLYETIANGGSFNETIPKCIKSDRDMGRGWHTK